MFEAIDELLAEHAELEQRLADPQVHADQALARKLGKRYAELTPIAEAYRSYQSNAEDIEAARELAREDPAFADEIDTLQELRVFPQPGCKGTPVAIKAKDWSNHLSGRSYMNWHDPKDPAGP